MRHVPASIGRRAGTAEIVFGDGSHSHDECNIFREGRGKGGGHFAGDRGVSQASRSLLIASLERLACSCNLLKTEGTWLARRDCYRALSLDADRLLWVVLSNRGPCRRDATRLDGSKETAASCPCRVSDMPNPESVFRRLFHLIDHEHLNGQFGRVELHPELLLHGGEQIRRRRDGVRI